jgi:hypothetical protein
VVLRTARPDSRDTDAGFFRHRYAYERRRFRYDTRESWYLPNLARPCRSLGWFGRVVNCKPPNRSRYREPRSRRSTCTLEPMRGYVPATAFSVLIRCVDIYKAVCQSSNLMSTTTHFINPTTSQCHPTQRPSTKSSAVPTAPSRRVPPHFLPSDQRTSSSGSHTPASAPLILPTSPMASHSATKA